MAQGCICITNSLDKIDIYMKFKHKHENMHKNREYKSKMLESSKLGYTSISNGYKWAIKHKHIKMKWGSLVVQV